MKKVRRLWGTNRRAAVVVLVAVTGTLMTGFAALTIDLGNLYMARTEMQRVADAAALAGVSAYFSDNGLAQDTGALTSAAYQRGSTVAAKNPVLQASPTLVASDVVLGRHDFAHPTAALTTGGTWNAVQVTVRRTNNANGPVPLYFAGLWGKTGHNLIATARAAVNDRVAGYKLEGNQSLTGFMPFTIPEDGYYDLVQYGTDQYSYSGSVSHGADGVHEVLMYPWKWKSAGGVMGSSGSGNFGLLDLGTGNSASAISALISAGGATAAQVQAAFNTPTLTFYDATHTEDTGPTTYWCKGDPGMKTSIQKALSDQIGKVFGFFTNRGIQANGSNAKYAISGVFFARIMDVDLSGGPNACGLIVQPVAYTDGGVITSPTAPSTYRTMGRINLVQ